MKEAIMKTIPTIRLKVISSSIKFIVLLITLNLLSMHMVYAHDGHHTSHAWKSCETKTLDEKCAYVMKSDQLYKGSCQQMAQALMCVRNEPIVTLSQKELAKYVIKPPKAPKNKDK